MDRIQYAGNSVLTGTAIALALLAYAQALSVTGQSAMIEIPSLKPDGSLERAMFLIGPSSEVMSESETSTFAEVVDEALVNRLQRRSRLLGDKTAVAGAPSQSSSELDDLGLN